MTEKITLTGQKYIFEFEGQKGLEQYVIGFLAQHPSFLNEMGDFLSAFQQQGLTLDLDSAAIQQAFRETLERTYRSSQPTYVVPLFHMLGHIEAFDTIFREFQQDKEIYILNTQSTADNLSILFGAAAQRTMDAWINHHGPHNVSTLFDPSSHDLMSEFLKHTERKPPLWVNDHKPTTQAEETVRSQMRLLLNDPRFRIS